MCEVSGRRRGWRERKFPGSGRSHTCGRNSHGEGGCPCLERDALCRLSRTAMFTCKRSYFGRYGMYQSNLSLSRHIIRPPIPFHTRSNKIFEKRRNVSSYAASTCFAHHGGHLPHNCVDLVRMHCSRFAFIVFLRATVLRLTPSLRTSYFVPRTSIPPCLPASKSPPTTRPLIYSGQMCVRVWRCALDMAGRS